MLTSPKKNLVKTIMLDVTENNDNTHESPQDENSYATPDCVQQ
jgi:hypothetical protein